MSFLFGQPTLADYADPSVHSFAGLGDFDTDASPRANQEWASQLERYQKAMLYFSGDIFNKRAEASRPGEAEPLLYPLQINLVKTMCTTQATALWGQWEETVIDLRARPLKDNDAARGRAEEAHRVISDTYLASRFHQAIFEAGFSQQVYGGAFIRIAVDPSKPHGIRFDKLMPYNVFVVWDPIQVDRILEAWIAIPIDKAEAALAYGIQVDSLPDETVYVEHWTEHEYETFVGEKRLDNYSGTNPWGFVPIEYIPRMRLEGFYGLPLSEDLMGTQDELNARLADIGDNINNASHPIRWIRNYRGNPEKDFETGPDSLWNLGQGMPGGEQPEVGVMAAQPEPPSSFSFIKFMLDLSRHASFTSPVAFGEDQGSQRSGVTLVLRLWPLLQQVRTTRIYWASGLRSLHRKALTIVKYRDTAGRYSPQLAEQVVVPDFYALVPQDQQVIIDEVIRRAEQDLISPEEAVAHFGTQNGTDEEEVQRIREWFKYKLEQQPMNSFAPNNPAGNSAPNDEEA